MKDELEGLDGCRPARGVPTNRGERYWWLGPRWGWREVGRAGEVIGRWKGKSPGLIDRQRGAVIGRKRS